MCFSRGQGFGTREGSALWLQDSRTLAARDHGGARQSSAPQQRTAPGQGAAGGAEPSSLRTNHLQPGRAAVLQEPGGSSTWPGDQASPVCSGTPRQLLFPLPGAARGPPAGSAALRAALSRLPPPGQHICAHGHTYVLTHAFTPQGSACPPQGAGVAVLSLGHERQREAPPPAHPPLRVGEGAGPPGHAAQAAPVWNPHRIRSPRSYTLCS